MIPLYDTLGPDSISYVINHSSISTCCCCNVSLKTLLKTQDLGKLANIICFDEIEGDDRQKAKERKITLFSWNDIIEIGKKKKLPYC
jgi:long-chain acyl-CoA synthetase